MITIGNKGPEIDSTNYWDTEHAQSGYLYLSFNAGAARLLVPDSQLAAIKEMRTGKYVIISRGKYQGREAYELLFEDNTDNPYSIHIVAEQSDRLIPATDAGKDFIFTVWTKPGKQLELPAKYRIVKQLPCLQAWK